MTTSDIFSIVFSTFAFVLSVISLSRSVTVDARDRRRVGLLNLNQAEADIVSIPERAKILRERWVWYIETSQFYPPDLRERMLAHCDRYASEAAEGLEDFRKFRSRLSEAWPWQIESLLIEIDEQRHCARMLSDAFQLSISDLDALMAERTK